MDHLKDVSFDSGKSCPLRSTICMASLCVAEYEVGNLDKANDLCLQVGLCVYIGIISLYEIRVSSFFYLFL